MKNTRSRSIVLTFMSFAFLFGIGLFTYRFITTANLWAMSPINKHFSGNKLSTTGDILDRNGVVLARSEGNKRIYHSDENIRKAVLHTIGDDGANISTAVQTLYKDELCGYNFIFGANTPNFFKQSKNIQLTLDSEICKTALIALGSHKGAVCVYNYITGEIICMVSTPTFDPCHPDINLDEKNGKYEGVYVNRVISASYAPGSVFKLITSVAGLSCINNVENKNYLCQQIKIVNGKKITCMKNHGNINLKNAMMESCNIYFADLAIEVGKDNMTKTANLMGFNKSFKFDRIETKKSLYDVKNADNYNLGWSGVGQYNDLLNPMHSVILMGAIANLGNAVLPHIVNNIYTDGIANIKHYLTNKITETLLEESTANKLKEMMRYNVSANYGDAMFPNLNVCAKTGTAEVGDDKEPHGWMVGFSANDKTPLAFSVIVENSGYGSKTAGPIASKVLTLAASKLSR